MADTSTRRFALQRVGRSSWVITDLRDPTTAAHPVAHIDVTVDDQVEVSWDAPVPLPVLFATLEDVLDSLDAWVDRPRGATKPIPIPHFPPPPH